MQMAKQGQGSSKMTHWLGALTALAEDLVPKTRVQPPSLTLLPITSVTIAGCLMPSAGFYGYLHVLALTHRLAR